MMRAASFVYNFAQALSKPTVKTLYLSGVFLLLTSSVCSASGVEDELSEVDSRGENEVRLSIEGISARIGEDEPRVLTILPWRSPTLPRRPRAELQSVAPDLVQPLDPLVLEHHRKFRRSLGVANKGGVKTDAANSGERQ